MKLYIVRHADAVAASEDPLRPLSPHGIKEATLMASKVSFKGFEVWHSSKLRAKQTAHILAPHEICIQKEGLNPNDSKDSILNDIAAVDCDLALVTHLPLVQEILYALDASKPVHFETATIAFLERKDLRWKLLDIYTPNNFFNHL
ncbi:MAG: hypothetical protein S4CHLAM81_11160 [Chlamydiales bacterium]|nr:hypothetical protein [Chlamydiales bacterium]MCH9635894.1 hypothetical protein [Chlamydiales bacterium]MCH9703875.1 histidine phosphatase family protein [Chlamydiota bacterium]